MQIIAAAAAAAFRACCRQGRKRAGEILNHRDLVIKFTVNTPSTGYIPVHSFLAVLKQLLVSKQPDAFLVLVEI